MYGDPNVTGKVGRDIEDGKCSWIVVKALEKATPEQKAILKENYGKEDASCVGTVRKLFLDIGLPGLFLDYEEETYAGICSFINGHRDDFPKELFLFIVKKIYKRVK